MKTTKATIFKKTIELLDRFRNTLNFQDFLPIYTGLLIVIEKDKQMTGGAFRGLVGNRNANVTVDEIKQFGIDLEQKNEVPKGFFSEYAFRKLEEIDSVSVCDCFVYMWNIYDEIPESKKGFELLSYIIEVYRYNAGKSSEFTEPSCLKKLVCKLADVKEGESVYDPCMGIAGYAQCLIQEVGTEFFRFTGTELNKETFYLANALMILGKLKDYTINNANSLLEPIVTNDDQLMTFDKVITNPPFSIRLDDREFEIVNKDLYGRFHYGIPGRGSADWLFIELAIAATKENGKTIVVTSLGPLFRSIESKVRANILMEQDILEAVVQLPAGLLFPYTTIPICILIFNKNKSVEMKNKVLSIDATDMGTMEKGRRSCRELTEENINTILEAYNNPANNGGFTKLFSIDEIIENDYSFDLVAIGKNQLVAEKLDGYISLKNVASDVVRGVQITPKAMENIRDDNGSHYLLNLSNIDNGRILVSDNERINPQKKWIKNYEIQVGDVIVAARGSFKCAIVEEELPACIASGNLIIIRLTKSYSPYVLKYFFESELGQQLISQLQSGVASSIINAAALEKIMIPNFDEKQIQDYENKICTYVKNYKNMMHEAEMYKVNNEKELNEAMGLQRI